MSTDLGRQPLTVLGPDDGDARSWPDGTRDRFLLDGSASGGRVAVVEHRLGPRLLAAPLHRHSREDEYSFVLEGRVGALLGDDEVTLGPNHFLHKPRGQWHTFWNAGEAPARILEIISPGGLEELFRALGDILDGPGPEALAAMGARYGCDVDFEGTGPIVDRHGLRLP